MKKKSSIIVIIMILIGIGVAVGIRYNKKAENSNKTDYNFTDFVPLIAHAGGAVREQNTYSAYTNSLEAITQNYELGHRVFEYDFYFTSDNKLACVHDWIQFGNRNGIPCSEEQWLELKTIGLPITSSRFTTMTIDSLMDKMIEYPDIFIVTDTKSTDFTEEMAKFEFQLIYEAAMTRDPKLMDRIIPQIYDNEMYDYVMDIYDFPCIIYTTYATSKSADEIISFAEEHENIKIITHDFKDNRFGPEEHDRIHKDNKLVYIHTINTYSEMLSGIDSGVDGFYTDLLLPSDYETYYKYKDISYEQ